MAAILEHWREAATLILICRTSREVVLSKSSSLGKLKRNFDYRILMLKRSGKSKFMPNAYVFPGGVASNADFSQEWFDLFRKSGADLSKWPTAASSTVQPPSMLSPMLTRQRDAEFSAVPADVAFRICAIRETFEESGVLLVRNVSSPKLSETLSKFYQHLPVTGSLCDKLDENNLSDWRKLVEKDPTQFLTLCKTYNFVPDIWSLYDWCNWLTPLTSPRTGEKQPRRFDTAFYLTVLDEMPEFVMHDSGEMVHTQWSTPAECLQSFRNKTFHINTPQMYEQARLIQFSSASDIANFVNKRSKYHMKRWMPVLIATESGRLLAFPGDCMYPDNVDLVEPDQHWGVDDTEAESLPSSPQNRVEVHSIFDMRIRCDLNQSPEHISPVTESDLVGLDDTTSAKL